MSCQGRGDLVRHGPGCSGVGVDEQFLLVHCVDDLRGERVGESGEAHDGQEGRNRETGQEMYPPRKEPQS